MSAISDVINEHHFTALLATAGESMTLRFGASAHALTVIPGRRRSERQGNLPQGGTATIDVRMRTFRCRASDYQVGGAAVEPREGHRFEAADGRVYQVVPPVPGLPVFDRIEHSAFLNINVREAA